MFLRNIYIFHFLREFTYSLVSPRMTVTFPCIKGREFSQFISRVRRTHGGNWIKSRKLAADRTGQLSKRERVQRTEARVAPTYAFCNVSVSLRLVALLSRVSRLLVSSLRPDRVLREKRRVE